MHKDVLPSSGLVVTPLKCGMCGTNQQWALPEDEKLATVLVSCACFACGDRGRMYMATRQAR